MNVDDKKRRLYDPQLFIYVFFLACFGSLMIVSAEMGNNIADSFGIVKSVLKQFLYLLIALAMMFLTMKLDFVRMRSNLFKICAVLMALLLLSCRLFPSAGGANAWLYFGELSMQPSEFAKIFILVLAAHTAAQRCKSLKEEKSATDFLLVTILAFFFITAFVQHDMGSAVIILIIGYVSVLICNKHSLFKLQNHLLVLMFIALMAVIFILSPLFPKVIAHIESDNYIVKRILIFVDPFKYQYDDGYQLVMSLVTFASGGLFGHGLGSSVHKYMNFPNQANDFILAIIVEELGFVGFLIVFILYALIICRLLKYIFSRTATVRTYIILTGVIVLLLTHFILNVGGVTGTIPLTGVPLILISSGGSSTIAFMAAIGLAQTEIAQVKKGAQLANLQR